MKANFQKMTVNFENIAKKIKNLLKRELFFIWLLSVALSLVLIVLSIKNKLPLREGDFVFLSLLTLLIALYRPRWIFFLFIGFIPVENIILASGFLPIQLRPYQFLGGILIASIAILLAVKRLKFKILKPAWQDYLIFSLVPFSLLSAINSPVKNISLKNSLILLSFFFLYFLIRNLVRNKKDLLKTAFFFASSWAIVTTFGFFQALADKFGKNSFETMFGRPNSTFSEPDWLGIFLCFSLAVFLSLIYFFTSEKKKLLISKKYIILFLDILVFLDMTLIILTLSRSAWIGSAVIIFFYLIANLPKKEGKPLVLGKFLREFVIVLAITLLSLASIHFGKLSKFDIFDRARSTATSEQKITIACHNDSNIPQIVSSTSELAKFSCEHIKLEEIESYKSRGKIVKEIFRADPNVMTRSLIYQKSWNILEAHPFFGVGFGTITQALGADERGSGLNESNIFLQIWAGSGILGLGAFVAVIGYSFIFSFRRVSPVCPMNRFFGCPIVRDNFEKTLHVFAILGISALIIPNLFNAGLLLAFFWLFIAIAISITQDTKNFLG